MFRALASCLFYVLSLRSQLGILNARQRYSSSIYILLYFKYRLPVLLQSDYGGTQSPGPPMSSSPKGKDETSVPPAIPRNLRLLHRTLSEEVKHRRRDSMPNTPVGQLPPQLGWYHSGSTPCFHYKCYILMMADLGNDFQI